MSCVPGTSAPPPPPARGLEGHIPPAPAPHPPAPPACPAPQEEASDYFVFVVSDANFQRYGIRPSEVAAAMTHDPNVKTFCIFIASLWNEAQKYCQHLPVGQSFVCLDPKDLPNILRQIFLSAEVIK